jgi:hypothetical protein
VQKNEEKMNKKISLIVSLFSAHSIANEIIIKTYDGMQQLKISSSILIQSSLWKKRLTDGDREILIHQNNIYPLNLQEFMNILTHCAFDNYDGLQVRIINDHPVDNIIKLFELSKLFDIPQLRAVTLQILSKNLYKPTPKIKGPFDELENLLKQE